MTKRLPHSRRPVFPLLLLAVLLLPLAARAGQAVPVHEIPLAGPAAERSAEISGMDWRGDELVLLPQYPDWRAPGQPGVLFAIPRAEVERAVADALAGRTPAPVRPREIEVRGADLRGLVPGFEGFESIVFLSAREAVLSVESHGDFALAPRMHGRLVRAELDAGGRTLRILPGTLAEVPLEVNLRNMGVEALVFDGTKIAAFYEANGRNVNPAPKAWLFGPDLAPRGTLPLAPLEYRLTDASRPDAQGRFWVINYLWPGERDMLKPAAGEDPGPGVAVERLVCLQLGPKGIERANVAPVDLVPAAEPRNWEGLAVLPGKGFLLATDTYPRTILGFVPYAEAGQPAPAPLPGDAAKAPAP
ncbi:hypothetical protein dsx2_0877 [Desulfovibrio sp. X2]|uniref:hypothetical protein n=1 Tax=Desulfovibrio sp. X2 TaxID=941449 RepID=UPI000358E01F|nr:hypothetical protein [Desulfovibrio sp. X2]EPR37531.1 hypothetical protein dsx2_0877 [Desulfovibrio sp. X2]